LRVENDAMSGDYGPYQFLLVFLALALVFALTPLALARLWAKKFSPQKPGEQKNAVYECGLESRGSAAIRFKSEYYLYGIIFLIFDVEALFLVPFAVAFLKLPLGAFIAMLVFILLLAEGLAWAWMKGVLTWK
jgi:NADH-quinone oxidoreductase subunit A